MSVAKPAIEFDGPANWHCMGVQYAVLTHAGVKPQGEEYASFCASSDEAWAAFEPLLAVYTADCEQIAWRHRPECCDQDGKFVIYSRLARFPQDLPRG